MTARTGSLPHDLAGSLSPDQFKKWLEERERGCQLRGPGECQNAGKCLSDACDNYGKEPKA